MSTTQMSTEVRIKLQNEYTQAKVEKWLRGRAYLLKGLTPRRKDIVLDFSLGADWDPEIGESDQTPSFSFGCPREGCTEPVVFYAAAQGEELKDVPYNLYGLLGYGELGHDECDISNENWQRALGARVPSDENGQGVQELDFVRLAHERAMSGGVQWLIPGVMEVGKLASLFGPPGTGKSLLALEWAMAAVKAGDQVVYLDEENDPTEIVARMEDMGVDTDSLPGFRYYSFTGLHVDSEEGAAKLLELIGQPDLVIFDSWAKFFVGASQNDDAAANRAYNLTVKPLRKQGVGILRLDHTGHDEVTRPAGTVAKLADVDQNWQIKAKRLDGLRAEVTLINRKSRTGRLNGATINLLRETGPLRHTESGQKPQTLAEGSGDPVEVLVDFMDEKGWPTDWSVSVCRAELTKVGHSAAQVALAAAVKIRKASGVTAS